MWTRATFKIQAHTNLSMALSQSNSANESRNKMLAIVKHARDFHSWSETVESNGKVEEKRFECDFYPLLVCSFGKYKDQTKLECVGKPYQTRIVLKRDLLSLLYELECRERAEQALTF